MINLIPDRWVTTELFHRSFFQFLNGLVRYPLRWLKNLCSHGMKDEIFARCWKFYTLHRSEKNITHRMLKTCLERLSVFWINYIRLCGKTGFSVHASHFIFEKFWNEQRLKFEKTSFHKILLRQPSIKGAESF